MLSDSLIRSLKLGDKKRHTDRDGLVLELRPSKKQLKKIFIFRFQYLGYSSWNILKVIWWDREHELCPSNKKNT